MRVAFLINDLQLSGGVGVVLHHARELGTRHGFDVSLVLAREQELESWNYDALEHVHVVSLTDAQSGSYDVAVCTWWQTAYVLFTVPAERYAFFVQSLEDRFYRPDQIERRAAAFALDLPVAFVTEAGWIADTLAHLRPEAPCHLVRNGIDKAVFAGPQEVPANHDGPLRILVEGNAGVWFKHVPEALEATRLMAEPRTVTLVTRDRSGTEGLGADRVVGPVPHREMAPLYAEHDVVLKLSSVEGMFGPPLEGFHMGATCVVTPVTGHEEYVEHGVNGLVCDWDDLRGTARLLDLLSRDHDLLQRLRGNALETARAWPTWEQQGALMAGALRAIADAPAPAAAPAAAALMRDVQDLLEHHRVILEERNLARGRLALFGRLPVLGPLYRLWRRPSVQRVGGPLFVRYKKRLGGS